MFDRVPKYPGRVKLVPVEGQENVFDMVRADEATQEGDPLNKATLLKDATAALFGLGTGAVPDDVLAFLGKYNQHWWRRRSALVTDDWVYLTSADRNAYPDGIDYEDEYEYLGIPFGNAVTAPTVETGSYKGTGTYGRSNPNSLTFDSIPLFVLIFGGTRGAMLLPTGSIGANLYISTVSGISNLLPLTVSLSDTTVSWYSSEDAYQQANVSDVTFQYVAILR